MRYPVTTVNPGLGFSKPIASTRALADLRSRLSSLTPDASHADWMARATAHTRPAYLELPAGLAANVRRLLTTAETHEGLPREYAIGLLRRSGRDVRWPGLPTVSDVIEGLAYEPTGGAHDPERLARHTARRTLAEAAAARLAALTPYVDDGRLGRLTWTRMQIVTEAATRADAAERAAWEDGSAWGGPHGTEDTLTRERDPTWHRRQLRNEIGRTDGHVSWILGLTGGQPTDGLPRYCSRWTLDRARQDAAAAKEWAANSVHVRRGEDGRPVIGADGDAITVSTADLIAGSRRARRAQLYALCLGIAELGVRLGYTLAFATLTLPPEYHPHPATGGDAYDPTTTPQDARAEQQRRWHRARAMMHKRRVRSFAGMAKELHGDGAPHSHICEYVHPDDLTAWTECLTRHWPETDAHAGRALADGVACQIRTWDDAGAASVAAYLYGYASKSLDASEGDEDDDSAAHAAACRRDRLRRWSWVGYRRGLAGDWQRVARERECPECPVLGAVWTAIHERRYADALEGLGALTPHASPVVRDYTTVENKYGETVRHPHALRRADATDDELCSGEAVVLAFRPNCWGRVDRLTWGAEQWTWNMLDEIRTEAAAETARMMAPIHARISAIVLAGDAPDWAVAVTDSVPRSEASEQASGPPEGRKGVVSGSGIPPPDPWTAADWAALAEIEAGWTKIAA